MIIVQTPLRVSFFGGGTDFPSFYCAEGGCVLSSTIDKYIFVTAKRRFDHLLRVGYTRTEMVESIDQIQHELIRESFRMTGITYGVEITTMGDIPTAGTGLGSSSTVTVGALHALYTLLGDIVPAERLAREACEIEMTKLAKPIGIQDQYIVSYGGLRFLEFLSDGRVVAQKIELEPSKSRRLNESLLLFYTGTQRSADSILQEQKANMIDRGMVLRQIKRLAYDARNEVMAGNVDAIGEFLHEGWVLKKQLASQITNPEIDRMYEDARKAGAIGGKITGAGGGGFLLLYCPVVKQDAVRAALHSYQELPFRLESDGSKVIFNYKR
ncbi:MAG: GHMP kinase [Chloroflexi bacterium RBG_16_52_11]|nr:MAG: GHMP kinase [Chloroflexi bacterium RBG_16_52_11]